MPTTTTLSICARLNVLLISTTAIGGSLLTAFSCQFFSYRTIDGSLWDGFESPFFELPTASVGLFSYSQLTTSNEQAIFGDSCLQYPDWQSAGQNAVFQVAQWSCIFAPIVALLAWVQVLFEMICCRFCGGFLIISALFLLAAALQAGTFLLFADTEFCLEAESVNECTFKNGSYYSLGATVLYIIVACLAPNVPSSPGQKNAGCCIYTRWAKNDATADRDRQAPVNEIESQDDPEAPMESDETTKSINEGRSTAIRADGSLESKSITVRPDGSVQVEVQSLDESGSNAIQRWVYPNEAAARFAGHITDTFDEGEEEVEISAVEEWDTAEELVSALQQESGQAVSVGSVGSSTATPVVTNESHGQDLFPGDDGNNASKSVLIKPDGTVDVSITTPNEDGPPSIQGLTYPSEAAAQAAGHL